MKTLTEIAEKIIENCQYGASVSDIVDILQSTNFQDAVNARDSEPVAYCRRDTVLNWKGQLINVAMMFPSPKGLLNPIPLFTSPQPDQSAYIKRLERIAELEKDAERYRWLKEQNADLDHDTFVVLAHDSTAEEQWQKYWVGSDLDKSIDEAMKESE